MTHTLEIISDYCCDEMTGRIYDAISYYTCCLGLLTIVQRRNASPRMYVHAISVTSKRAERKAERSNRGQKARKLFPATYNFRVLLTSNVVARIYLVISDFLSVFQVSTLTNITTTELAAPPAARE